MVVVSGTLFSQMWLDDQLTQRRNSLLDEIGRWPERELVSLDLEAAVGYLIDAYSVRTPVLDRDNVEVDAAGERTVAQQHGYRLTHTVREEFITFAVPFDGDGWVLRYTPTTYSSSHPPGAVREEARELLLTYDGGAPGSGQLKRALDGALATIEKWLAWSEADVRRHNEEVERLARVLLRDRQQRAQSRHSAVEELGFRLRQRPDARRFDLPKRVRPTPVRPTAGTHPAEPAMEDAAYEQVLEVLTNAILGLERSPRVARNLSEEEVRDYLLIGLNSVFAGSATGETFNGEGKTDILIREGGRNVFIAECKIWRGPKSVEGALDQLLRRYLVWRDTKAALVLIIRRGDATELINRATAVIEADAQHRRTLGAAADGIRRDFVMHARDDQQRSVRLALLPAVLPAEPDEEPVSLEPAAG